MSRSELAVLPIIYVNRLGAKGHNCGRRKLQRRAEVTDKQRAGDVQTPWSAADVQSCGRGIRMVRIRKREAEDKTELSLMAILVVNNVQLFAESDGSVWP